MDTREQDEVSSWRAATLIMIAASTLTLVTSILGMDPFSLVFDVLIVYVPTAVLVLALALSRTEYWIRRIAQSTEGFAVAHTEA